MKKREFIFTSLGNNDDLEYLHQLFIINSVDSKMQGTPLHDGEMGLEQILIALISSTIIPSVLNTINIWLQNRKKELIIIDKDSGKELHLTSNNGKGFSDSEMDRINSFFQNES